MSRKIITVIGICIAVGIGVIVFANSLVTTNVSEKVQSSLPLTTNSNNQSNNDGSQNISSLNPSSSSNLPSGTPPSSPSSSNLPTGTGGPNPSSTSTSPGISTSASGFGGPTSQSSSSTPPSSFSTSSSISISSVSPITATGQQTIVISGNGFGYNPNTSPVLIPSDQGNGLVQDGVVTGLCDSNNPSMEIMDEGGAEDTWTAGYQDCGGSDKIGIYIQSWSDNEIVLNGIGKPIGKNMPYQSTIRTGDPLTIIVYSHQAKAEYKTTVR